MRGRRRAAAAAAAPLDRDTFLFEKRFQLALVSGKPAAFWIDAHATLEVVEVSHSPGALR